MFVDLLASGRIPGWPSTCGKNRAKRSTAMAMACLYWLPMLALQESCLCADLIE